jgi:putative DNA primase/helicase
MNPTTTRPPKPPPMPPNVDVIPSDLRALDRWVVWKWEWSEDKRKWDKPPYRARDPRRHAKATDPKTWASFADAMTTYRRGGVDGIGFAVTKDDPFCGVDVDDCRDPATGALTPEAQNIVDGLCSYTEVTPSGTGVRVWVQATLPGPGNRRGNIEMYDSARYFTVTGAHLAGTPETIDERPFALAALHARIFGVSTNHGPRPTAAPPEGDETPDEVLLGQARLAYNRDKFVALYDHGDLSYHNGNDSQADASLCARVGPS